MLNLTYDDDLSRVRLNVTGISSDTDYVMIERSTDRVRWETVRGGLKLVPVNGTVNLDDFEFHADVQNYYRARSMFEGPVMVRPTTRASANDNTLITVQLPDEAQKGDLLLLSASIRNTSGTVDNIAGWKTEFEYANTKVLSRVYDPDNFTPPTLTFKGGVAGDTCMAHMTAYKGLAQGVVQSISQANASAQDINFPGGVTISGLIGFVFAWKADDSTLSNFGSAFAGVRYSTTVGNDATHVTLFTQGYPWIDASVITITGGAAAVSRATSFSMRKADQLWVDESSITPALNEFWVKFPAAPYLNRKVRLIGWDEIERQSRMGVFEVSARRDPIVVTDVHSSRSTTVSFRTSTISERDELDNALSYGHVMFLHCPSNMQLPSMYVAPLDYSWRRPALRSDAAVWSVPIREVAKPAPAVYGSAGSWQTVLNTWATWNEVLTNNTQWQNVTELIGSPSDIIVT